MSNQKNCDNCGEQIVFLERVSGLGNPQYQSRVAVDATSVEKGDTTYEASRHVAHFKTCGGANSKPRQAINYPYPVLCALLISMLLGAPAFAQAPPEQCDLKDLKGLVFYRQLPTEHRRFKILWKKKYRIYTYEKMDGTKFDTTEFIKHATNLTKFDEVHPRWAHLRDGANVAGALFGAGGSGNAYMAGRISN